MAPSVQTQDTFTADECRALDPYFTNTDRPVFALRNLPETVKGALFSRYSRSAKSLRRLFLDEFLGEVGETAAMPGGAGVGSERADKLYAKVFNEYGGAANKEEALRAVVDHLVRETTEGIDV